MARSKRDYLIAAGAAAEAAHVLRRRWTAGFTGRVASFSLRRGMRSGNRGWLYVAAVAQGLRLLQRIVTPKPEVFLVKLRPGEGVEIREIPRAE
jgi:hypothetical protein